MTQSFGSLRKNFRRLTIGKVSEGWGEARKPTSAVKESTRRSTKLGWGNPLCNTTASSGGVSWGGEGGTESLNFHRARLMGPGGENQGWGRRNAVNFMRAVPESMGNS